MERTISMNSEYISFQRHERSLRESFRWELRVVSKKKYEYVVLMTMNSESSSSPSTLYAQVWRYHGFKRPYARTLQDVSVISVGELGYSCILDLFFSKNGMSCTLPTVFKRFNPVAYVKNVGRVNHRHFRRRYYANSFGFLFFIIIQEGFSLTGTGLFNHGCMHLNIFAYKNFIDENTVISLEESSFAKSASRILRMCLNIHQNNNFEVAFYPKLLSQ